MFEKGDADTQGKSETDRWSALHPRFARSQQAEGNLQEGLRMGTENMRWFGFGLPVLLIISLDISVACMSV